MFPGQPSRQVLRRAIIRARRMQRSLLRRGHGIALSPLAIVAGCLLAGPLAYANPTDGQVAAGSARIGNGSQGTLNVFQQSNRAVINWQGFSIGAGETVNFLQPSPGSVTLNRVLGSDPSAILGRLNANGTVMLVNPNGIVFGPTARVDVGGLVASTANIRDDDFMAGRYEFTQASPFTHAAIDNQGLISIRDSGLAALVAPRVRNSGVIEARLGRVALGAAHTFTLDFHGDGLLSFGAGSAISEAPEGGALVTHSGEIRADGGSVLLTARAVKGVVDRAINTDGLISATTVHGENGRIVLSGGDAGLVAIGGRIDASATHGGQGGSVLATGERVAVAGGTRIDVSGRHGGGEIALGSTGLSDPAAPFSNKSDAVSVAAGAVLNADATEQGRGGNVTLWSTQQTVFNGAISARGGAQGGDGGFAEVSSQKNIGLTGDVNLGADKGRTGTLLIDPTDLRITDTASGGTQNGNAGDGTVQAGDTNQGSGATLNTVSRGLLEGLSGNANIVLQATGQITVDAMASGRVDFQTTAGHSVTLQSTQTGGIRFVDAGTELRTQGGAITLEALGIGSSLSNLGRLTTNGGAVALRSTGDIQLGGAVNAGAGTVQVVSTVGSITNVGPSAPLLTGSAVTLTAGAGDIGAAGSAISTHTTQLGLEAGGSMRAASDMTLSSLSVAALHIAPGTHTYEVNGSGLNFQLADGGSVVSATQVSQSGLNLALSSDRSIEVGAIDLGGGTLQLDSTGGNLIGLAGHLASAGSVSLTARGSSGNNGAIGSNAQSINTATPLLTATSGSGGTFVANTGALNLSTLSTTGEARIVTSGSLTVGNVNAGTSALSLTANGGGVQDDGDAATRIIAGTLHLSAAGAIGTSGNRLQTNATEVSAYANLGGIYVNTSAAASTLSNLLTGNGAIDITTGGATSILSATSMTDSVANSISISATGDGNMSVSNVDAGSLGGVTLSTQNGSINSGVGVVHADRLTASTTGGTGITLYSAAAHLDLQTPAGAISVTQAGNVTLDNVVASGSTVSVTGSGDITIGNVRSALNSTATLSTSNGVIQDDGNSGTQLSAGTASLSASGAIGTSANPIQASLGGLSVNNGGNVYLTNSGNTLTTLSVTNRHATQGVANTLQITSPFLTFDVADDGTQYTLNRIIGVPLTTLSFSGDQTTVLGQVLANSSSIDIRATSGDLVEDGNEQTRVSGGSVTLGANQGHVGSVSSALGVNTTSLTVLTRGDLYVNSISDLGSLTITSTHPDGSTSFGMLVKAPSLSFNITDSPAGHHVHNLFDASGLTLGFTSDRDITLGQVDLTYSGNARFTSTTGNILDDGNKTTQVLANSTTLSGRALGASGTSHLDLSTGTLSATATTGGIYIDVPTPTGSANDTNTLTLSSVSAAGPVQIAVHEGDIAIDGNVSAANQAVSLSSDRGSILNPSGIVTLGNGSLTLNAAGSIGSTTRALTLSANGAALDAQAGTSIAVASTGSLTLGTLSATTSGTVSVNATGGSLLDDGQSATAVTGNQVTLSATGAVGNGTAALTVDAPRLSVSAGASMAVNDNATLTELSLTRLAGSSGTLALTAGGGQVFSVSEDFGAHSLTQVNSSTPLAFAFNGTRSVNVGSIDVGAAGSAILASTGGGIANLGTGSSITAGTVGLSAASFASIGSSTDALSLHGTTDLTLSAGRDIHVASDAALSNLAITSTNSSTSVGSASQFGIAATGQTFGITDAGTTQSLDFGGTALGNFGFTNQKNLQVGSLTATGEVTLTTSGGGANANISSDGGSGRITANRVLLSATSSTAGGGSIGTSGTALRLDTPTVEVTGSANVYLADSQNLTSLGMTLSHGTNTTYGYGLSAGNINSFAITDGATQSLGLAVSGAMNFSYSVDRALSLSTVDVGTSSTGMLSLTSRGAPTGTNPAINRSSGSLTAGSVSLTAVGSNGNVGGSATLSTNTRSLSIASGGNVSVSNATTLNSLSLDAQHRGSASTHSYAISSTGLTFSVSDTTGTSGITLTNIAQSGLDLSIKADRTLTVSSVNTGAGGKVHLDSNWVRGSGANAITTGDLTLSGGSVYGTVGNIPLYTVASTLSSNLTGSLYLSNTGSLTLLDNRVGGSARVASSAGSILQGSDGLFSTPDLTLSAVNFLGTAGTGNTVQTSTRRLTLSAGRDLFVNNDTDLHSLDITSNHAAAGTPNTVAVTADRLTLPVTDNGGGSQYTLGHITDASGIDFRFAADVDLLVSTADVKPGHALSLSSTGASRTSIINNGSSLLTGNSVSLLATGSVGAAGSAATRMQTDARLLSVTTGRSAHVDNAQDLSSLSFNISQDPGGPTPVYQVTAPALSFDLTDDGTTHVNTLSDTSGLNFSMTTRRDLAVDVIDVQHTGTVVLSSSQSITGDANPAHRITAASTSVSTTANGGAVGTLANPLRISSPLLAFSPSGALNIESDTHVERLSIATVHPSVTYGGNYSILSVPIDGGAQYALFSATDSVSGTALTNLVDTSGLAFSFSSDRAISVGELDLGTAGSVYLSNTSGSITGDGNTGTQVHAGSLSISSQAGSIGATGSGNSIEATTASVSAYAPSGATYLNLHGRTAMNGVTAGGPVNLVNDIGDIALGAINAGGNAVTVDNQGGSILSGSIANTSAVTLTASGSIGNLSALSLSANGGGTTTLTATAAAAHGATGSVDINETYALTATAVTAPGTVSLGARSLAVGTIDSSDAVSLSASQGSITGTSGANLVSGSSVSLTASYGTSNGIGSSGTRLRVSAPQLTLETPGNIYITGLQDLDRLAIDRANSASGTNSAGILSVNATNLTLSATDASNLTTFSTLTDTTGLDFSYLGIGQIAVGTMNVGSSGSVLLQASLYNGDGHITATSGSSRITAGSATLQAYGSDSRIGTSGTALGLAVDTLTASSGTGGMYLTQAGSLNLSSLSTTGGMAVNATAGDLTLGTLSFGANSTLNLTAGAGRLLAGGGTLTGASSTSAITLSAANGIGTAAAPVVVNGAAGNTVSASVTGSGDLHLHSSSTLSGGLSTSVANGSTDITAAGSIRLASLTSATDALGNDINVTASAGDITIDNVSVGANARQSGVNLSANAGRILANSGSTVTGYDVRLFGASGLGDSAHRVTVSGQRVQVGSSSGAVYLGTSGASVLTSVNANGLIDISTAHDLMVANAASGGAAITVVGSAGNVDLIAGNLQAGSGSVSLVSNMSGGTVQDDGSVLTRIQGGSVTLVGAAGVGSASQAMHTTADTLSLSNTAGGSGIHVNDNNTSGVTLSSVTSAGGAIVVNAAGPMTATSVASTTDAAGNDVTLTTSSGDLTLGSVSAGASHGVVTLSSAGSLLGSGSGTNVSASHALLEANGDIGTVSDLATGAGTPIRINVGTLDGLVATGSNRVVNIDNLSTADWTLGASGLAMGSGGSAYLRAAGNFDVSAATLPLDSNLLLSAGGTLTLPSAGLSTTGALRLSAVTDMLSAASGAAARNLHLGGGSVHVRSGSAGGATTLSTSTATLDAGLTGAGALNVVNTGALDTLLQTANGDIDASASGSLNASSVVAGGTSRTVTLTATSGDLTAGTVNAGASGTIALSAANGSLLTSSAILTASTLNLTSGTGIGSSGTAFDATGTTVNAQVVGIGSIYLGSSAGLTTGTLTTAQGDIAVTAAGNLQATGTVSAGQSGDVSLTSTGGNVTLDQAHVNSGSDATHSGLTVQSNQITLNGGSYVTTGAQTYTGNVTLGANTVLSGNGVAVTGTLDGARDLTVSAGAGATSFGGALGGTTRLGAVEVASQGATTFGGTVRAASVATDSAGTLVLPGTVDTTGAQTYREQASLAGDTTLTGSIVALIQGVDAATAGGQSLTVNGDAVLGSVGANQALSELTVSGASTLSGSTIATTGSQTYTGAVTLGSDEVLVSGSGQIAFGATLDGAHALTLGLGTGDFAFDHAVGGTTRLGALLINSSGETRFGGTLRAASLATDAPGTLLLNSTVDTTGTQTYGEHAVLGTNGTLTGSTILLAQGIDATTAGGQSLTVNGNAVFGNVGATQALSTLTVSGASTLNGTTIATTGDQNYTGAVTLGSDQVLGTASGRIAFGATVDGTHALTLDLGAGDFAFDHAVGGTTRLGALLIHSSGETRFGSTVRAASVTTDAPGTLVLAGTVDTTGTQTYGEHAVLGADSTLSGSTILLARGVDATTAGGQSLAVNGNAVLGNIGDTAALSALTVSGTTALDGSSVATTGQQAYGGAFTASGDASLASSGGSLVFGSTVDGPAASTLSWRAEAGDVDVAGALTVGSLRQTAGGGMTRFRDTVTVRDDLTLAGLSFTFDQQVTTTQGLFSIANRATGTVNFASDAKVQAATGFIQTGGSAVYLPAIVRVTQGPITLEAPAHLPSGLATIETDGDITMSGLLGPRTVLTMNAGPTGKLAIGLNDASAEHKLQVANFGVATAGSASLYGSIGGQGGALAASRVNSPLVNAPYFLNDTPWGPVGLIATMAAVTAPKSVVPSTPGASSLFNREVSASNVAPDALSALLDPAVLTLLGGVSSQLHNDSEVRQTDQERAEKKKRQQQQQQQQQSGQ
jgi:filamentous hemagglutinin family protein